MRNEKKVNKAAYLVLCLTALAVSCLIFACFSPEGGNASFSITIGDGGGGRAVEFLLWEPETKIADLEHTITLTNDSGLSIPPRDGVKAGQKIQFSIDPGHWVITVEAYLIIDESKVLKARGSKPVDLKPGYNGAITIDMDKPDDFGSVSVTDVMLGSDNIRLRVGNQGILNAMVKPDNATNKRITWKSDNLSVATVTSGEGGKGTVTAKGVGTAIITVTTQDGERTASCTVEVVSADSEDLTGTVTITGTAEIGQTLTADTGKLDKGTYTYQWKRGDTLENAERIGTNSNTYTTVSEDGGKYIWVFVTCAEYRGEVSATIGPIVIPVTLNSVTVNAPSTVNTTALILKFDKAIIGLTAEDITLGGVSRVNKGDLIVSNNGSVYTLSIGGFTSGGALTVTVTSPSGYRISGSPKIVNIYYITYTVIFNSNGGSAVPNQTVAQGGTATRPTNPTRASGASTYSYSFVRWCSDEELNNEYNFNTPINNNITLYAQWSIAVTSESIANIKDWLETQDTNNAAAPYIIKLKNVNSTTTNDNYITNIRTMLNDSSNAGKYVYLDLSESTGITTIPANTFYGCATLAGIILPSGVISMGDYAFYGCTSLTDVTIPSGVTSIGQGAFYGCTSLTDVTIPDTVPSIRSSAFKGCTSLTSITIPNSVTNIGDDAFQDCADLTSVTIPDSVTNIGQGAFYGCTSLASVTIGNKVETIGNLAFGYCRSLDSVNIPDSVITIRRQAFSNCINLASVTIGNKVKTIEIGAFENCAFASVNIPSSVTGITGGSFNGCASLTSITVYNDNTTYSSQDGVLYNKDKTMLHTYPKGKAGNSFTIPSTVISIQSYAFYSCTNLVSIIIPSGVTTIGNYAFQNCASLASVTIPDSVTGIGSDSFYNCTSLTSVTLPTNAKFISIGSAFQNCNSLTSITIPANVTIIGGNAFSGCSGLVSVIFQGTIASGNFNTSSGFPGDLRAKFYATDSTDGTPGTYTRPAGGTEWTKQP